MRNSELYYHLEKYLSLPFKETMAFYCREEGLDYERFRRFKYNKTKSQSSNMVNNLSPILLTSPSSSPDEVSKEDNKSILPSCSVACDICKKVLIRYPNGVSLEVESSSIAELSSLVNISTL